MRRCDFIISICSATVALALVPALAMGQTTRTITLSNQCTFPVFPGVTSGAVSKPPTPCPCDTGQVCGGNPQQCFWNQLATTNGQPLDAFHLKLSPVGESGSTAQVSIRSTSPGDTIWSGKVWAGTDVDSGPSRTAGNVASGYCAKSQNGVWTVIPCDAVTGSQNTPITLAEFTLQNSKDFYDISVIGGANIPLSMEPTAGQTLGPVPSTGDPNQQYYWCTAPGSVNKSPTTACTWQFAPINNGLGMALVQHQQTPALCGDPSQSCPNDAQGRRQVCGIAYDSSKGVTGIYQECGNTSDRGGTWSAIQICTAIGYDNRNLNPNQVSQQLINNLKCGTGPGSAGNAELFQCTGTNSASCYDPGATANCCGCPMWNPPNDPNKFKPLGGNLNDRNRCYANNLNWTNVSYPWLPYLKNACGPVYTYQFDDHTGTITCSTAAVPNTTNYTITFCPAHLRALSP